MIARETLLRPDERSEEDEDDSAYRREKEEKGRVRACREVYSKHIGHCDLCGNAGVFEWRVRAIRPQHLAVAIARYEVNS